MLRHELSFFRARISIENLQSKDMFHIPFNLRGRISTQRFSMPGVPCLYLATTTYGAWIELGRPDCEMFFASAFKIPNDLKILNLCISQMFINGSASLADENEIKELETYIEIYPLILATSFRILELDRKFKSEYIISQLVMQAARELGIDGVAYLSKKTEDYYAYPQAVNLAILVPDKFDGTNNYWDRAEEVELTEPRRFSDILKKIRLQHLEHTEPFRAYVNEQFKGNEANKIMEQGKVCSYINTKFSEFDEFLVKEQYLSFKNVL